MRHACRRTLLLAACACDVVPLPSAFVARTRHAISFRCCLMPAESVYLAVARSIETQTTGSSPCDDKRGFVPAARLGVDDGLGMPTHYGSQARSIRVTELTGRSCDDVVVEARCAQATRSFSGSLIGRCPRTSSSTGRPSTESVPAGSATEATSPSPASRSATRHGIPTGLWLWIFAEL